MSWKQLLAQRKVQLHTTSKQELDGLRALIERDLTDAALAGLSADRRFARGPLVFRAITYGSGRLFSPRISGGGIVSV